jgi:DNA-binding transcriptional ArsR family regulator
MARANLTPELRHLIAERFKALGEPARLHILDTLRRREMSVSDLVEETGLGQANVSKHLQLLLAQRFVRRRKAGLFAYYALADRDVLKICDIMCGRLESEAAVRRKVVSRR